MPHAGAQRSAMSTRISRVLVEIRLYLYLMGGVVTLHLWVPLIACVCLAGIVLFRGPGGALEGAAGGFILLAVLASPLWWPERRPRSAVPLGGQGERESLDRYPILRQVAEQTATELGQSSPAWVNFRLSPQFRHWGAPDDPDDREVTGDSIRIDFSRAGICSVFEFRCDLAKAALQPRMPRWLSRRVLAQVDALADRLDRDPGTNFSGRRWHWFTKLRESELNALRAWRLFAEMETDRAIASAFGKRCVASWIEKSWYAEWVFPVYQQIWLEPAWQRGFLPPTMDGFRRLHEETGANWLMDTDADRPVNLDSNHELSEIARWQPHRMRLLALEAADEATASVYDTRPASLLLGENDVEERVVRRFLSLDDDEELERISWADYPVKVILAEIDDALHEQAELFEGKCLQDLPAIAGEVPELVYEMVHMPFLPPSFEDRLASMPNALSGFLIKGLLSRGWEMSFDLVKGVTLTLPGTEHSLDPGDVVHSLAEGGLSGDEFWRLVGVGSTQGSETG